MMACIAFLPPLGTSPCFVRTIPPVVNKVDFQKQAFP
jgi:hypothetical protein